MPRKFMNVLLCFCVDGALTCHAPAYHSVFYDRRIEECGTPGGQPSKCIRISGCGELAGPSADSEILPVVVEPSAAIDSSTELEDTSKTETAKRKREDPEIAPAAAADSSVND